MEQPTSKKAALYGILILIFIGILYAIWFFFLNKGTISFISDPPFSVETNETTKICSASPCDIVLAPGNYTFTLTKEGYKSQVLQTGIPIWGTNQQTITFTFISIFNELGLESDVKLFTNASTTYSAYIERNKENGRQTLYYQSNQPDSEPILATSFTRDLKDYFISESIDNNKKIAVVDTTETQSTVYLVDLEQKTRDAVLGLPVITGIKWLNEDNLMIEGRTETENNVALHLFNLQDKSIKQMAIETELENVEALNSSTLIAATNQPFTSTSALDPEGELINLSSATEGTDLIFITFSTDSENIRLIKTTDQASTCSKIQLSTDQKRLLCLEPAPLGDKVFELIYDK